MAPLQTDSDPVHAGSSDIIAAEGRSFPLLDLRTQDRSRGRPSDSAVGIGESLA